MKFIVYGKPVGKGRPKFARRGNYVQAYTPENTRNYEELVKTRYLLINDRNMSENGLKIKIKAIFKPPKGTSKKKIAELIGKPYLHKPDADNIAKIICDALNGVAYKDDNQIYYLSVEKEYGEENMTIVEIEYDE